MACVRLQSAKADSEMEEGEIIDDLDDLSDISSEEEFLLRQRMQVLENYNTVLERKKAKQISLGADGVLKVECKVIKQPKHTKVHKHKKSEQEIRKNKKYIDKENGKIKGHKKKNVNRRKKSETSEDSDDDFINKRRKLAEAVTLNISKSDTSTLKDRITKMLSGNKAAVCVAATVKEKPFERRKSENDVETSVRLTECQRQDIIDVDTPTAISVASSKSSECLVSVITDQEKITGRKSTEVLDDGFSCKEEESKCMINNGASSDDDIELLRQNALQTKHSKSKQEQKYQSTDNKAGSSEDEDSDTTELRMICLKSALLKKAIEMKQKQKLQKRLSQSAQDDFEFDVDLNSCENQTDVESVDMDIGSDGDDKSRSNIIDSVVCNSHSDARTKENKKKEEDIEDDEDLLRAKLLTSLTKNLPNLVEQNINTVNVEVPSRKIEKIEDTKQPETKEEKKFIIELGGSDSEGEHEATKNLTKMHMKLSEQEEFQRKLDIFLKSSRMQVEKNILPDVVQPPPPSQIPVQKLVPKTVNSLPRSEQIEYNNLVKRMAELEKMKNARQSLLNMGNQMSLLKDTLKPINTVKETIMSSIELDERIAASRRKIADESAKMLKLKGESAKLSQKYKIVLAELRNIRNAVRINRQFQRTVQNSLCISRLQHQTLLKSLTNVTHSNQISTPLNKPTNKLLKENDPSLKDIRNLNCLKAVKVSVVNDFNRDITISHPRLTVQVNTANNKKSNAVHERIVDCTDSSKKDKNIQNNLEINTKHNECVHSRVEKDIAITEKIVSEYISPLDALKNKSWEEDPNAFLCPFEVGGSCRDPDCKYLHPKTTTQ